MYDFDTKIKELNAHLKEINKICLEIKQQAKKSKPVILDRHDSYMVFSTDIKRYDKRSRLSKLDHISGIKLSNIHGVSKNITNKLSYIKIETVIDFLKSTKAHLKIKAGLSSDQIESVSYRIKRMHESYLSSGKLESYYLNND